MDGFVVFLLVMLYFWLGVGSVCIADELANGKFDNYPLLAILFWPLFVGVALIQEIIKELKNIFKAITRKEK